MFRFDHAGVGVILKALGQALNEPVAIDSEAVALIGCTEVSIDREGKLAPREIVEEVKRALAPHGLVVSEANGEVLVKKAAGAGCPTTKR